MNNEMIHREMKQGVILEKIELIKMSRTILSNGLKDSKFIVEYFLNSIKADRVENISMFISFYQYLSKILRGEYVVDKDNEQILKKVSFKDLGLF